MSSVDDFILALESYPSGRTLDKPRFNPWIDYDAQYDIGPSAPEIRKRQLATYLEMRQEAKILLIAEALGYQGGHFSGIPMTSERILLGNKPDINPELIIGGIGERSSNKLAIADRSKKERDYGFNEPTATLIWTEILASRLLPSDYILWNIFPFHPYKKGNMLSNRPPTGDELKIGFGFVKRLIALCPHAKVFSIGNAAAATLDFNNIPNWKLRHPANGGVPRFRTEFRALFSRR
jgi:hypothetical protein